MQSHTLKTATTTYNATCHLGLALVGLFSHLSASLDIVLLCSSRDERGIILVILIRYTSRSTWWRSYFLNGIIIQRQKINFFGRRHRQAPTS